MSVMLQIPRFNPEAEEAQWWFDNQDLIAKSFEAATKSGTLRHSTLAERLARARTTVSPVLLDPADASLARELAAKRGESYEAFVRRVLHAVLELEKTA